MTPKCRAVFWVEGFGSNPAPITEKIHLPPSATRVKNNPLLLSVGAYPGEHQFKGDYSFSTWELEMSPNDPLYTQIYQSTVKTLIRRQRNWLDQLNKSRHAAGLGPQALRIPMEKNPECSPEVQMEVLLSMLEIRKDAVRSLALEYHAGISLYVEGSKILQSHQILVPLSVMERLSRLGLQLHIVHGAQGVSEDQIVS